ncbi:acetyl-CoA hydrolase/transferase family protein [Marinigracilibium pacificum]|uniref:Acetyl-CoA hydrolase/transferase family protein n=1 Tax=Marinigracilibium pacificum TaxID=2729599 RepID=A0A848J2L0_9BACT|nr:acetyl-CoA hydrolase/transferase family protein [Marinigracilibium pacificum]NMM48559.1 acetyl-CoA hydrolase/transferase family protein [Marinigracilibium pacificum]
MRVCNTAAEAVELIKSGDNVFLHSAASTPQRLVNAMTERHNELKNVSIYSIHTEGEAPYAEEQYADSFNVKAMFVGSNIRKYVQEGSASYIPMFLSEIPIAMRNGIIPIDVALIQVSPPNKHGYCSLGISVDVTYAAINKAKKIIAQVNPNVPRTSGDGTLHISQIDAILEVNDPLFEHAPRPLSEQEILIGKHIAGLIEDGSTLQTGIGAIPDAALLALENHKNLGMHTEMFSDGVMTLLEKGVINGSQKAIYKDKVTSGFCIGSKKLYDFIDDNPVFEFLDSSFINDTKMIRQNPKVIAINSALEVDLYGQVCADSIGSRQYSGVGGQMDFIRGASLSPGGKPIIALPSQTRNGKSKIVCCLTRGASVVTTRAHVHWIVTEFGAVNLYGKTLKERTDLLISIAHPDHQEALERDAYELL